MALLVSFSIEENYVLHKQGYTRTVLFVKLFYVENKKITDIFNLLIISDIHLLYAYKE